MRVPLAQQAQALLGQSDLVLSTEGVDEVALRIGQMGTMGLVEVLDRPLPRHWTQRGRSWGWTGVIWLASLLTAGDHRNVAVEADSKGLPPTLSPRTGPRSEPLACSDDRLGHLLPPLSTPPSWHGSAADVHARRRAVSALLQDVSRWEATTVSGAHAVPAGGRWQCGPSQDDPTRPQSKVMMRA